MVQQPPPSTAFEITLPSLRILALSVSFVIDQFPRTAVSGRKRSASFVLQQPFPQICRVTDIKPVVRDRAEQINIVHGIIRAPDRVRRSRFTRFESKRGSHVNPESFRGTWLCMLEETWVRNCCSPFRCASYSVAASSPGHSSSVGCQVLSGLKRSMLLKIFNVSGPRSLW